MRWLAILALCAAACAHVPPREPGDSENFRECAALCERAGGLVKGVMETVDQAVCFCTKRPLDPS